MIKFFICVAVILMIVGSVTPYLALFPTGLIVGFGSGLAALLKHIDKC